MNGARRPSTAAMPHSLVNTPRESPALGRELPRLLDQHSNLPLPRSTGAGSVCVVLQPSYIPWRGFFHQIQKADIFVFYDDVQYDKHGWRNRNLVKTPRGSQWLTIPVASKGAVSQGLPISEVEIVWDRNWTRSHWGTLAGCYARAPYFDRYAPLLREFYGRRPIKLADFTIELTVALARELGLNHTRFVRSSELRITGTRTERLVNLIASLGATHYVSGPSAREYLDESLLARAGITLEYMSYSYPEYPQLYPPFDGRVSILDLLFMQGPNASRYIWGAAESSAA